MRGRDGNVKYLRWILFKHNSKVKRYGDQGPPAARDIGANRFLANRKINSRNNYWAPPISH